MFDMHCALMIRLVHMQASPLPLHVDLRAIDAWLLSVRLRQHRSERPPLPPQRPAPPSDPPEAKVATLALTSQPQAGAAEVAPASAPATDDNVDVDDDDDGPILSTVLRLRHGGP